MGFFKMTFRQMSMQSLPLIILTAVILHYFTINSRAVAKDSEKVQTTKTLRWQNRLLFVRTESQQAKRLINAWQQEFQSALNERKLLILHLTPKAQWAAQNQQSYLNAAIADDIGADCLTLVGLDGGIKFSASINAENLNKLFDIIDAMPMRRAELN